MTRLKLALMACFVVVASIAIGVWQFHEALHRETFGNPMLDAGPLWGVGLALVMASIPVIFFAVGAWLALTWLLFRPGELEDYKARRLLAGLRKSNGDTRSAPPASKTPGRVFEDE